MKILFNVMCTVEVPDADEFPRKEEVEEAVTELFEYEGLTVHELEITNLCAMED